MKVDAHVMITDLPLEAAAECGGVARRRSTTTTPTRRSLPSCATGWSACGCSRRAVRQPRRRHRAAAARSRSAGSTSTAAGPTRSCRARCQRRHGQQRRPDPAHRRSTRRHPRRARPGGAQPRGGTPGRPRLDGGGRGRSAASSCAPRPSRGWPALHVRAFSVDPADGSTTARSRRSDPRRMRLLRLERLAPAVLLLPLRRHPRRSSTSRSRGRACSSASTPTGGRAATPAQLEPRNATTFEDLGRTPKLDVPFRRRRRHGVVDIQALEQDAQAAITRRRAPATGWTAPSTRCSWSASPIGRCSATVAARRSARCSRPPSSTATPTCSDRHARRSVSESTDGRLRS